MQSVSESAKKLEINYIVWMLSVASIVLFILTIDSFAITDLEPYGFYYFRALPATYWAGLAISIASVIISVAFDSRKRNDARIIPILLVGLFLYGTPVISYEVPRFTDVFAHGAESLPVISDGHIDQADRYAREYPSTFILLGVTAIVQGLPPLALIRYAELFTILLFMALVYCIGRHYNSRFAALAPLSFMGAFWVDQGHYSPQGLALVFYLVFFLSMIKAVTGKESRRGWLAIGLLALFATNITSPTNSFFLLLNLVSIAGMAYIVVRKRNLVSNRAILLTAIAAVLFLSWSIYNAETRTVFKWEEFEQKLSEGVTEGDIKVTPSPSESYSAVITLRTVIVASVVVSGAIMSIVLLKRKQKSSYVLILIGWFATASFIVISMYLSSVLLSRNFLYVSIAWAVLVAVFFAQNRFGRRDRIAKVALFAFVIALLVSIPATRYGRDPTTYASPSLVNSAEILAESSKGGERVISYFIGSLVSKYYAAASDIRFETLSFDRVFQTSFEARNITLTKDWIQSQGTFNSRMIFSDPEQNNIAMKYNQPELYDEIEDGVREKNNLIINNGSTRVYSSTSSISPAETRQ